MGAQCSIVNEKAHEPRWNVHDPDAISAVESPDMTKPDCSEERGHPPLQIPPSTRTGHLLYSPVSMESRPPVPPVPPPFKAARFDDDMKSTSCSSESEPERCATCLQALAAYRVGCCVGGDGRRVCTHYFHLACLRKVRPRKCPHCRAHYQNSVGLPKIEKDPAAWARLVAVGQNEDPSRRDVISAFQAMLMIHPDDVEHVLAKWPEWHEPWEYLSLEQVQSLAKSMAPHLPAALESEDVSDPELPEHDMPAPSEGHRSSNIPGDVCSCGRVHAHRGDRVKRGPAWTDGSQDGELGSLGTIVKEEEGVDAVLVQWDSASLGVVRRYKWPAEPELHEVEHANFEDVADGVREISDRSGLSSAACTELLRRASASGTGYEAVLDLMQQHHGRPAKEEDLRDRPTLFHRCRVVPEQAHFRQWFESCPACPCLRSNCRGGVRWNAQAARHLGREGFLLKIDERDGTALVEMTGRCNCKLWFPLPALQRVYDPDSERELRFAAGTSVECKIDGEWHRGTVSRVWWRPSSGWGNRPTAPYSVKLLDGRSVFAPRDSDGLIKALCQDDVAGEHARRTLSNSSSRSAG